jgi:hypothetical protein
VAVVTNRESVARAKTGKRQKWFKKHQGKKNVDVRTLPIVDIDDVLTRFFRF